MKNFFETTTNPIISQACFFMNTKGYGLDSNSPHRKAFRANVNYAQAPNKPEYDWWRANTDVLGTGFETPAFQKENYFDPETETNQVKPRPEYTFRNKVDDLHNLPDFYNYHEIKKYKIEIPAKDYLAHEEGNGTLYFNAKLIDLTKRRKGFNDKSNISDICYIIIDIDCHSKGTKEDALAALKLIQQILGVELYWEFSQGGIGINALVGIKYFQNSSIFNNSNFADNFKSELNLLVELLTVECIKAGITLDKVEAKALPITYQLNDMGLATSITRGSLGRIPRNLVSSQQTAVISFEDVEYINSVLDNSTPIPIKKEIEKKVKNAGSLNYNLDFINLENLNHCLAYLNSIGFEPPAVEVACGHQFGNTILDAAVAFLCLVVAAQNKTVPSTKFVQLVFEKAFPIVGRQFHGSRWKANRDQFGLMGIIGQLVEDGHHFIPPESTLVETSGKQVEQKKGKSCQYAITNAALKDLKKFLDKKVDVCPAFSSCVGQSILSNKKQNLFPYQKPLMDPRVIDVQGRTIQNLALNAA